MILGQKTLSDVTLVCEEDYQIEAHRIVLAACSPFFSALLKKNNHSHPMIYMRGLKAKDLLNVVDFIYHGEANIYQDDLDGFLALADELQLKGPAGSQEQKDLQSKATETYQTKLGPEAQQMEIVKQHDKTNEEMNYVRKIKIDDDFFGVATQKYNIENSNVQASTDNATVPFDSNQEDLKAKIDLLMENLLVEKRPGSVKCAEKKPKGELTL